MNVQQMITRAISVFMLLNSFNAYPSVNGFIASASTKHSFVHHIDHAGFQRDIMQMTSPHNDITAATDSIKPHPQQYSNDSQNRRRFLSPLVSSAILFSLFRSQQATASDSQGSDIIWMTGKAPIRPGQKPRDKNDVTGTKRDPNFLRSISDCKNQCENNSMSANSNNGGYAKGKEECLSECQDICCTTYEQCTFAIVPRI